MKKVVLFGCGRYAESVYYSLACSSSFDVAGFTVDSQYMTQESLAGLPVVPFERVEAVFPPEEYDMLLPLSFQRLNRLREEKYHQAKARGYSLVTFISPRATTMPGLVIGDNCIVCENTSIGHCVEIGNNVSIGPNVVICHHAVIKDHCFISPGVVILGSVTIGPYTLLGANSTIKEKGAIGAECLVGAGVTITTDTPERGVYLGAAPELLSKSSDEVREWLTWG
jgi:sugar O-acyltransferase (sialic acid O-acetyltransferase NeuD family)